MNNKKTMQVLTKSKLPASAAARLRTLLMVSFPNFFWSSCSDFWNIAPDVIILLSIPTHIQAIYVRYRCTYVQWLKDQSVRSFEHYKGVQVCTTTSRYQFILIIPSILFCYISQSMYYLGCWRWLWYIGIAHMSTCTEVSTDVIMFLRIKCMYVHIICTNCPQPVRHVVCVHTYIYAYTIHLRMYVWVPELSVCILTHGPSYHVSYDHTYVLAVATR